MNRREFAGGMLSAIGSIPSFAPTAAQNSGKRQRESSIATYASLPGITELSARSHECVCVDGKSADYVDKLNSWFASRAMNAANAWGMYIASSHCGYSRYNHPAFEGRLFFTFSVHYSLDRQGPDRYCGLGRMCPSAAHDEQNPTIGGTIAACAFSGVSFPCPPESCVCEECHLAWSERRNPQRQVPSPTEAEVASAVERFVRATNWEA